MLKENDLVGVIAIYRQEMRPFTDKQIALVQNFYQLWCPYSFGHAEHSAGKV